MIPVPDAMTPLWKRCLTVLILGMGLSAHSAIRAEAGGCGADRDVGTGTLDEWTWRQLNGIYEDVGDARYDEAFDDLTAMLERSERGVVEGLPHEPREFVRADRPDSVPP